MNIYVGNLANSVNDKDLEQAFTAFGQVESARVITDMYSGMSKGFGFVEMPIRAEAQAAIQNLDGKELKGQALKVNEARPRPGGGRGGRPSTGGGGAGGGGGGRGRMRRY